MVPDKLAQYEILRKLGAGGSGEVYLARDTRLERDVALKVLRKAMAADADRARRFLREARAASKLTHPNVAQVYEAGESDGRLFIAMEYVDGETLAARLQRGRLSLPEILQAGVGVADALDEAHSCAIVHRDIKPANVIVSSRGRVKVVDFGLAKLSPAPGRSPEVHPTPVGTGVVLGTLDYLSPEQALGRPVDHRTDVFSLGIVLYQVATGQLPFVGESLGEKLEMLIRGAPRALEELNPALPTELGRIVRKCLEKDPARRYQTARDLMVDLRNLQRDSDPALAVHWAVPGPSAAPRPALLPRLFAWLGPSPRRWWEIDHLVVLFVFTPFWIRVAWTARSVAGDWGGLALFLCVVLGQAVRATLRLYVLVGSFALASPAFLREVQRIQPWMKAADVATLVAVFVTAVVLLDHRLGLAALVLGIAIAWLVKMLLADPAVNREAFPREAD